MSNILPLTEEHEMYRKAIASFMEKEVVPYYAAWEAAGEFPKELYKKMGDNGYLCTWADEKYGGVNGDFIYDYLLNQEIVRVGAHSLSMPLHCSIASPYLEAYTNEEQRERWLPGCVSGDLVTAIAMTEPGAGSDLLGLRTRAVKDGDHYVLNGSKTFISNGTICDLAIVAAKTDASAGHKGISLFVVEDGTQGFVKGKAIEKIGLHAAGTSELFFEDCRIPAANLLGKEGQGFKYLMEKLQQERILTSSINVAMAQRSLDLAIDYVQQRQMFGQKLSQFQNTQFVLAEVAAEIEIGRCFIEHLVVRHCRHENIVKEVSMAKLWLAEMNIRAATKCLQLFGGYGYCKEYDISRQYCDARVYSILAGASEVMKVIIAKEIGL